MKRLIRIAIILCILISLSLNGCGSTTSDKSYYDAFKRSLNDDAVEVENDYDIEYVLFRNNWEVRVSERARLAELLKRMISKKGYYIPLEVYEGYFTFGYDNHSRGRRLDISVKCKINGEDRWLFIDCGEAYVYDRKICLDKSWYLSLRDLDSNDIQEPWAWCYYQKSEIEDDFWKPHITYASDNYIYMTSGIYLRSY